jgi:outer membrane protein with beta-barrel domain
MLPLPHSQRGDRRLSSDVHPDQEKTDLNTMKAGLLCLALCAAVAPNAHAQMTWTDKAFVNVSGGYQGGSRTLTTNTPFDLYDETGTVTSSQKAKSGGLFDVSAGYKVWRNLAAGIGFSHTGGSSDATVSASVPDPLIFNQLRPVSGSSSGLKYSENTVHLVGTWMVPVTDKIDVGVSAGPSIFHVTQDLPGAVDVSEPGPTLQSITVKSVSKTAAGINLGVDVTYMVTKRMGVGGLARYTWGSAQLAGAAEKLTVGGFQIGGGLRVRF